MRFPLKYKKSAGVAVTPAVHRMIARGNSARDRQQWIEAGAAYEEALQADPSLGHIFVQLGNVSKEAGDTSAAEAAYLRAAAVGSSKVEAFLQLGHLFNKAGNMIVAGQYYLQAFKADPVNADAASSLHRVIARSTGAKLTNMIELLRHTVDENDTESLIGAAPTSNAGQEHPDDAHGASLVFDASDLISYYSNARLPTGIQRVQIEAIKNALDNPGNDVRICCFIEGRDGWLEVPTKLFCRLADLSVTSGDRNDSEWMGALNKLHLRLALSEAFVFPHGAFLINLGTSWWLQNYFLFVRNAKAKYGVQYVPFVHDFIPVMRPEHCTKDLTRDFISWAVGVFAHADHFLVNSEATSRDLQAVAAVLEYHVDPKNIAVIRLDADFRKPDRTPISRSALANWLPDLGPFVLLVSTVESRKGHTVAMDAWLDLIRRHGPRAVPRLVCVGNRGWLNSEVYRRLEQNELLAKRVTMLSGLADEVLSALYRNCLFTIYPSLYEGWGLPITESLCYGKPVIASNSTSLPEAGGDFAVYVDPGSPLQLADAVERMVLDNQYREGLAARIRAEFHPRSWRDIARQIDTELMRMAQQPHPAPRPTAPTVTLGAYHPIMRNMALRIWPGSGSGEIFRMGPGWLWPSEVGCWTRPGGGLLVLGLPRPREKLRVGVLVLGAPEHDVRWQLQIKRRPSMSGILAQGDRTWLTFDYPVLDDGDVVYLRLVGERIETGDCSSGDDWTSIGIGGFFVHAHDDVVSRLRLLEAVALNNLDDVNAYREIEPEQERCETIWNGPDPDI